MREDASGRQAEEKKRRGLAGNVGLHHGLKQMLSNICRTTRRAARDCLFKSLRYEMLFSRSSALITDQIRQKKHTVVVAGRKSLRNVHGWEDIETRW